jgi:hypothetical protein
VKLRDLDRRVLIGVGVGVVALLLLMASTGPNPDQRLTSNFRRVGGPCLELEQWGMFGWTVVGQTHSLSQVTSGQWQVPMEGPPCTDIQDTQILVRMPATAPFDDYRICGIADDQGCITFQLVPFFGDGGGGP